MDESSYNYRLALFVCCTLHVCLEKTEQTIYFLYSLYSVRYLWTNWNI